MEVRARRGATTFPTTAQPDGFQCRLTIDDLSPLTSGHGHAPVKPWAERRTRRMQPLNTSATASALAELVGEHRRLVVTTSLNANPNDREMDPSEIQPVQVLDGTSFTPVEWLRQVGESGLSALTPLTDDRFLVVDEDVIYLAVDRELTPLPINFSDLHEVTADHREVLAANRGTDEIVVLDPQALTELRRIRPTVAHTDDPSPQVDRFHINQGLRLPSGELAALAHHVNGRQLLTRLKSKMLKSHGNGGVIGVEQARTIPLSLKGPHNVRVLSDGYLVLDSGRSMARRYDSSWTQILEFPTAAWGRGCAVDEATDLVIIGNSPIRRRYRTTDDDGLVDQPVVEAHRLSSGEVLGSVPLAGCEQINNVYLFASDVARLILDD